MLTQGSEGPAPVGDIVATVYKDSSGSALYVEPLQPLAVSSRIRPRPINLFHNEQNLPSQKNDIFAVMGLSHER